MNCKMISSLALLILLAASAPTHAEILTIDEVTIQVQPVADGEVKLFFEFDLPKLPADVSIDYAVLSFGVNVTALPEEAVAIE